MTEKKRFASVWHAIEDTPQVAANMRARSDLMMKLAGVKFDPKAEPGKLALVAAA